MLLFFLKKTLDLELTLKIYTMVINEGEKAMKLLKYIVTIQINSTHNYC